MTGRMAMSPSCVRERFRSGPGVPVRPSKSRLHGRYAGRAVRDAGPRALVVGARLAGERADEARSPSAPVPRQVHPAARRSAHRSLPARGGTRARSVRRLGDDARAGARVGAGRDGRRARGVQLPADRRQDRALRPGRTRRRAPRGLCAPGRSRHRTRTRAARAVPQALVRTTRRGRALRVPRSREGV